MTNNETELLTLIRNSKEPEKSMVVALNIILSFLEQPLSVAGQQPACQKESA